jgi:DNA-binding transcriptional LysR family regulator
MQNLEPILIFITVAEMGSFTHAADSLGIQKGRASTAVRKLEEDVGVRLLHRTARSVQLTEDGRAFHARARDLPAEVDDLHSMFASNHVGASASRADDSLRSTSPTIVPVSASVPPPNSTSAAPTLIRSPLAPNFRAMVPLHGEGISTTALSVSTDTPADSPRHDRPR